MQFTRRLHEPIRAGLVTCSIRFWTQRRVKAGGRYPLGSGPGHIVVDAIHKITPDQITPSLATTSGFESVDDLLATARHGRGQQVYLVHFHYVDHDR